MDRVQQDPAFVSQALGFLIQQLHSGALSGSSNSNGAAQGGTPTSKDANATTAPGAHPTTEESPAAAATATATATAVNEDPQVAEGTTAATAGGGGGGGVAPADKVLVWSAGPVPSDGVTAGLQSGEPRDRERLTTTKKQSKT